MNKDVLYIDVEDDITSIVGKVKASGQRIIAIVPPKRIGVLQSAVNIRLLARAASSVDKRIVLITSDNVLAGLAASAKIPVAKTLQSKPELADAPVIKSSDDNDIIDGRELPVGEIERSLRSKRPNKMSKAISAVINSDKVKTDPTDNEDPDKKPSRKPKIPDFNVFRKKFLIISGSLLFFVLFMVWAIWLAPRAVVTITAKTTTVTIDKKVTLKADSTTDSSLGVIKSISQEQKSELSVKFQATGKKEVGDKATGAIRLVNSSRSSVTVPANTVFKHDSGLSYILSSSVTVPGASLGWECSGHICPGTVSASVTAAESGSKYNGATGSLSGSVDSSVSVSIKSATSGGTDKTATVVSDDDIKNAISKLDEQKDDSLRKKLEQSFGKSSIIIKDSYQEHRSRPSSSVQSGSEANGDVVMKTQITAKMIAIEKDELSAYLDNAVKKELEGKKSQKIYKNGSNDVKFSRFDERGGSSEVQVTANAIVGPTIDENQVKEYAKGKNYGAIQSKIEPIEGVEDVDTKFWPFWVKTVPGDINRIKVEFKLNEK